jgi:FtsP/CotA-like multicopper oxidase with cupredoxin domain
MRQRWIFGAVVFAGLAVVAFQSNTVDEFLWWARICTDNLRASRLPRPVVLAAAQGMPAPRIAPQSQSCPPPPTTYQRQPDVASQGDLNVPLALATGAGIGTGNQNLCFVNDSLPAAPVIRINHGNRLTVELTNTLGNTGPDNTQNCPIENYLSGPPIAADCSQPEEGFQARPGPDAPFYPIQTNIPHLADGSTNLHTHGLEVSPRPCHDEVIRSTLYAANWGGPVAPLFSCQEAPNELTYSYDIPADHPTGLYWYHTHRHGQAQAETMMGATGAIVIEGDDDALRHAHGVTDDVMIIRDFPNDYVSDVSDPTQRRVLNRLHAHARTLSLAADPTIDPRIDRDNEVVCATSDPDAGGPPITRLTLNGALVQETPQFPPPDDQVLLKTMAVGERQIWRIVNAGAQTYVSPQLVLSENGINRVLPLVIIARDGVPVHDDDGSRHFDIDDTARHPLLLATANRVEILVHAPPAGATLYLDSLQVTPGCAGDGVPPRRLLRVVSAVQGAAAATSDDADIQPRGRETQFTHLLDQAPDVSRAFAFTEYPRGFTVGKSTWVVGPPPEGDFDPNATDFYVTMIRSSDGEGVPVRIRPFDPHTLRPDVVVHLNGHDSVTEEWTVENYTLEIHAFHIHQIHFRDVTNGDDNRAPVLDTVNVPPAVRGASTEPGVDVPTTPGFVRLRMKFTRASIGEFVFHCHILEHEDNGMMQKVRVVAD